MRCAWIYFHQTPKTLRTPVPERPGPHLGGRCASEAARGRLSQRFEDRDQLDGRGSRIQNRRIAGLGKLMPVCVYGKWQVEVAGSGKAHGLLEQDLSRGRREEIRAAHHVGDALCGVVDRDGKLIGMKAIASA